MRMTRNFDSPTATMSPHWVSGWGLYQLLEGDWLAHYDMIMSPWICTTTSSAYWTHIFEVTWVFEMWATTDLWNFY